MSTSAEQVAAMRMQATALAFQWFSARDYTVSSGAKAFFLLRARDFGFRDETLPGLRIRVELTFERDAAVATAPAPTGQPPYPEGDVVGPCVCGSWPGGKCLRCPWIPAQPSSTVTVINSGPGILMAATIDPATAERLKKEWDHKSGNVVLVVDSGPAQARPATEAAQHAINLAYEASRIESDVAASDSAPSRSTKDRSDAAWAAFESAVRTLAAPQSVPLTEDAIWRSSEILATNNAAGLHMPTLMGLVRAVERHHGITGEKHGG